MQLAYQSAWHFVRRRGCCYRIAESGSLPHCCPANAPAGHHHLPQSQMFVDCETEREKPVAALAAVTAAAL